jgi:hypothetical protein
LRDPKAPDTNVELNNSWATNEPVPDHGESETKAHDVGDKIGADAERLQRAADPKTRGRFFDLNCPTFSQGDEIKIARTKYLRKVLVSFGVDGGKSFPDAVESMMRDGGLVVVAKKRGGMIATRHRKASAKSAASIAA